MKKSPKYQCRIESRDKRHGLAPAEEQEERPEPRTRVQSHDEERPEQHRSNSTSVEVPGAEEDPGTIPEDDSNTRNVRQRVEKKKERPLATEKLVKNPERRETSEGGLRSWRKSSQM